VVCCAGEGGEGESKEEGMVSTCNGEGVREETVLPVIIELLLCVVLKLANFPNVYLCFSRTYHISLLVYLVQGTK
jgi:hypothetical protein